MLVMDAKPVTKDYMGILKKVAQKSVSGTKATDVAAKVVQKCTLGIVARLNHQW